MTFRRDHELHGRRFSRNLWVAACLAGFAALVFGLSVVKIARDGPVEGFDHVVRPALAEEASG